MKLYLIISCILYAQVSLAQVDTKSTTAKIWSLDDCINYALKNNIVVKDATLNKNIAAVEYEKAKSLRLPNLIAGTTQIFSNGNAIDPITSNFVPDQIHSNNVGINSSVTLFQGNQISNQIKQNNLLLEQSIFLEKAEKNNIVLNILASYLQTLFSKENITISENNYLTSEKEVLRAKARLDAETIALSEYTEAQSQAATQKYKLIVAKNNYQQNIIALKQLLELSPLEDLEIESINENMLLMNLSNDKNKIYNNALNYLPELKASELNIAVSQKKLDIIKGSYMPTLALTGSIGTGYTSINDNTFSNQFNVNLNQRLGLSLSIPIFNRNQTKSAVKTANINIEKAQIQKQIQEKEIYKNIETAYQNALSAQEQVIASEASKVAAEQSYKLAQKKYEFNNLSTTDLVISQNIFTNTQQNYLQAKYLYLLYYQLLQFYQGNDIKL